MGTLLLLDIPKVPSDSTIQELLKSVFGMLGIKNLTRLDSDHMWMALFEYFIIQDILKVPWNTYLHMNHFINYWIECRFIKWEVKQYNEFES